MFICNCTVTDEEGTQFVYKISTTPVPDVSSEELPSNNFLVHIDAPIAKAIILAIDTKKDTFECNGRKYKIVKHLENRNYYSLKNNKYHIKTVDTTKTGDTFVVYVYKSTRFCLKCYNEYGFNEMRSVRARVKAKYSKNTYELNVDQCLHCHKYFIAEQAIRGYESKYGVSFFNHLDVFICENYDNDYNDRLLYNIESVLSRNGYSARKDGPSTIDRQNIIIDILETKQATKTELKKRLNNYIKLNGNRFPCARIKWQKDLDFLNEYNSENEEVINAVLKRKE